MRLSPRQIGLLRQYERGLRAGRRLGGEWAAVVDELALAALREAEGATGTAAGEEPRRREAPSPTDGQLELFA